MKHLLAPACAVVLSGAALLSWVRAEDKRAAAEVKPGDEKHKHTNRLIDEKSPYLLQHAHNPVDWYPWSDEAFELARKLNKPVLLSIGYSTCHWCHVMERESFENEEIAAIMNKHFVCIKLDREERPDVDKIYITAVQALSGGSAGWPLNVFLTPDRKPFYGGTYFPPRAAPGRPSWPDLCNRIAEVWADKQEAVVADADNIAKQLAELMNEEGGGGALQAADLQAALERFEKGFDPKHGGWGAAPKFPRPGHPRFMLQAGQRFADPQAVTQVGFTCGKMAAGGMYDQLGGGFCRYSVDAQWLVPHFEKMLYDNAQLVHLYLDAYLLEGKEEHADVVRDILRYVFRDMTHPEGGFYSAEDADSEGKEGKFYCWTLAELEKLLSKDELGLVVRRYGITPRGNFVDHSDPEPLPDQNVLSIVDPKLSETEAKTLTAARLKMMRERDTRVRPGLDDKILTSWNGLMLGAVARASAVLGDDEYLAAAEKNYAFLRSKMWQDGKLYHRWREGERDSAQLFATYAYFLEGVIELYGVSLDPAQLELAIAVADQMISSFYDPKRGGFFQSAGAKDLIMRVKDDYDGAEPSGNSVAVAALLKLAAITENKRYRVVADKTLDYFGGRMKRTPEAVPVMLMAADFALAEPKRVVISGEPGSAQTRALVRAVHSVYRPNKVVLGTSGRVEEFAKTLSQKPGEEAQAYICTGKHCELPTASAAKIKALLTKGE